MTYFSRTVELDYSRTSLKPFSVVVQAGLCQTWSETQKTGFLTMQLISFIMHTHVHVIYTPNTPLLYSKTRVYRSKHFFLNFVLKHRS